MYHVFVLSFSLGKKEIEWAVLSWKYYWEVLVFCTYLRGERLEMCYSWTIWESSLWGTCSILGTESALYFIPLLLESFEVPED